MREYWANVYQKNRIARVGAKFAKPTEAEVGAQIQNAFRLARGHSRLTPAFRIHVRLKPEGAPKRYRDDAQRHAWEAAERIGITPRYD